MPDDQRQQDALSGLSPAAIQEATAQLAALRTTLEAQQQLRANNVNPDRPDEAALSRLDSSIKKNAAFIKKLRQLGEDNKKQILDDIRRLNLTKYVSEAVAAIAETPLKASDFSAAVEVCCALHQRYADFAPALAPALAKPLQPGAKVAAEEERALQKRQRSCLRLLGELLLVGVVREAGPFITLVRQLASFDFAQDKEGALHAVSLLGMLCKTVLPTMLGNLPAAAVAAGAIPAGTVKEGTEGLNPEVAAAVQELEQEQQKLQEALGARFQLAANERSALQKYLDRAFEAGCDALIEAHAALIALDQENARTLSTRLVLPEGASEQYEQQRKAYEGLHRSVTAMSEGLVKTLPNLVEDAFTRLKEAPTSTAAAGGGGGAAAGAEGGASAEPVFEDLEMRAFYENLPDLWSLVPAVLLKDALGGPHQQQQQEPGDALQAAVADLVAGAEDLDPETAAALAAALEADVGSQEQQAATPTATAAAARVGAGADTGEGAMDVDGRGDGGPDPADGAAIAGGGADAGDLAEPSTLDLILNRLPTCVTRELCDELAVNFCYCNSKSARKRLVKVLVGVPRGSLQLLPYYARVAATLSQLYPDVGQGVLSQVESQFDTLFSKTAQQGPVEPRIRVVRYLAELAKFRIASPSVVLLRLKQLLDDFTGTNVDAAAALVESVGRFFVRLPESKVRMENLLSVMMKLRNVKNLDSRQAHLIDGAYFATRPPDKAAGRRRQRPPLEEYIRHLIFEVLDDGTIVEVLKKLMKLPWDSCERYVLKCLLKVVRVRFSSISLIASLAGGLSQYHESLGISLVDLLLEELRAALEAPAAAAAAGGYQQRLAQLRLLGEAYNYMLLDSRAIFDVLYMLIGYGHEDPEVAAKMDPPDEFFRLRMVMAVLNTCGMYFNKGAARRRLDRFLTFLAAYVLAKDPLPLDIENDLEPPATSSLSTQSSSSGVCLSTPDHVLSSSG